MDGRDYAEALAGILRQCGANILGMEDSVRPGDDWADRIQGALHSADILILIGTPGALRSNWIESEISYRHHTHGRIIPIIFRELSPTHIMPLWLREIMWLQEDADALLKGPSHRAIEMLLAAIDRIVISEPPPSKKPLRSLAQEKRPLNEGKLILVGRGEVGKTSIVRGLAEEEFRGDESKTQGINITNWPLRCNSETVWLNVWDFGGQEIMHATHQFFLTERSLYLLVLNGREGGEDVDAEYWLKHIESFGGESPVIVVQNKIDQHPFELNYRGLQGRYPQIRAFVKTDCKEKVGLDELREAIQKAVLEMPEIRMQFPVGWFKVKERLESMEDDYMGYEGFCRLCDEEGVGDDDARNTLCWALHCLGIALNYREDSRLRETSVLKPEWVTQGIYKILNASTLAERQGELHLNDLRKLLPDNQYPVLKHHFILELMRKFSLCFPFPDDADRYLVPELLGKEEPEEASQFPPGECLNFEYHYGVLPEGLMPRFIVRSHTLSRGQKRWRSGVILAHEDCKALVTAEPPNRRVVVRVKGGDAGGRRRLLAVVRYDLDRINSEFKDRLDAQQKVPLADYPAFCVDYMKLVAFEKKGMKEFPEYVGQDVVMVRINELLNGVDLEAQRDEKLDVIANANPMFFSYSQKDEALRDELETHLKLLQREGVISTWHDRKILPGDEWAGEIDRHIGTAKIILLLISADFIASDYCWTKEVNIALERHKLKETTVIPILLRKCDWQKAPFGKLQGLPKNMKPITAWKDRDAAWTDVALGIRAVAERAKQV